MEIYSLTEWNVNGLLKFVIYALLSKIQIVNEKMKSFKIEDRNTEGNIVTRENKKIL